MSKEDKPAKDVEQSLACQRALEAANSARKQAASAPIDQLLSPPWAADRNMAESTYRVLSAARAGGTVGLAGNTANDLKINLALAAASLKEPDLALVKELAADLLAMAEQQLQPNGAAVYEACTRACLAGKAAQDQQRGIMACSQLLKSLEEDRRGIDAKKAQRVYEELLAPALRAADEWKKAAPAASQPAPGLDEFYARAAGLLYCRRYTRWKADWSPDDVLAEAVQLYGQAIEVLETTPGNQAATERLADYYLGRGEATAEQRHTQSDAVLADADKALQLKPDYYRGYALKARSHLVRSREQTDLNKVIGDLNEAIAAGGKGVEKCPPNLRGKASFAYAAVTLSCACLERANATQDPRLEKQLQLLKEAEKHALAVENIAGAHGQLALGNTYEDLAWLTAHDQEENYRKAISAFSKAQPAMAEAFQGDPMIPFSIGRCYYKALFDDSFCLEPRPLGMPSREAAIGECERQLLTACRWRQDLPESHCYLGQLAVQKACLESNAAQRDKLLQTAEREYLQAITLAEGSPYYAMYVNIWVRFPVDNLSLLNNLDDAVMQKSFAEARQRATAKLTEKLPSCPRDLLTPRKERMRLEGDIERLLGNASNAEKKYGQALPKDIATATTSDFELLIARSNVAATMAKRENNQAKCEAAIRDAEQAVRVALTRPQVVRALEQQAVTCLACCGLIEAALADAPANANAPGGNAVVAGDYNEHLNSAIQCLEAAVKAAPRSPKASTWLYLLAKSLDVKAQTQAANNPNAQKKLRNEAIQHLNALTGKPQGDPRDVDAAAKLRDAIQQKLQ